MEYFDGRYEKIELLGSGSFSEVWKVRDRETGVVSAMKIYTSSSALDDESAEVFRHEFKLMADANHPNLLKPLHFAISRPEGYPYLILRYCKNGNVKKSIGKTTEKEAWKIIRDISSALAYLHSRNPVVIHQDIKPDNILVDGDCYMLSDFGVSTEVKTKLNNFDNTIRSAGTIAYMAPSRFSKNPRPTMASDIWSLGATVYELLSGTLPFGVDGGLLQKKGADVPDVPGNCSALLNETLGKCMRYNTWERPKAKNLYYIATDAIDRLEKGTINLYQPQPDDDSNDGDNPGNTKSKTIWSEEQTGCLQGTTKSGLDKNTIPMSSNNAVLPDPDGYDDNQRHPSEPIGVLKPWQQYLAVAVAGIIIGSLGALLF